MKAEPHQMVMDFDRLSQALSRKQVNLSSNSLRKLWELAVGRRKLSQQTLNRLALFAGFQDWHDLSEALHGEADASLNYEEPQPQKKQEK